MIIIPTSPSMWSDSKAAKLNLELFGSKFKAKNVTSARILTAKVALVIVF